MLWERLWLVDIAYIPPTHLQLVRLVSSDCTEHFIELRSITNLASVSSLAGVTINPNSCQTLGAVMCTRSGGKLTQG